MTYSALYLKSTQIKLIKQDLKIIYSSDSDDKPLTYNSRL